MDRKYVHRKPAPRNEIRNYPRPLPPPWSNPRQAYPNFGSMGTSSVNPAVPIFYSPPWLGNQMWNRPTYNYGSSVYPRRSFCHPYPMAAAGVGQSCLLGSANRTHRSYYTPKHKNKNVMGRGPQSRESRPSTPPSKKSLEPTNEVTQESTQDGKMPSIPETNEEELKTSAASESQQTTVVGHDVKNAGGSTKFRIKLQDLPSVKLQLSSTKPENGDGAQNGTGNENCTAVHESGNIADHPETNPTDPNQKLSDHSETNPTDLNQKLSDDSEANPSDPNEKLSDDSEANPTNPNEKLSDDSAANPTDPNEKLSDDSETNPTDPNQKLSVDPNASPNNNPQLENKESDQTNEHGKRPAMKMTSRRTKRKFVKLQDIPPTEQERSSKMAENGGAAPNVTTNENCNAVHENINIASDNFETNATELKLSAEPQTSGNKIIIGKEETDEEKEQKRKLSKKMSSKRSRMNTKMERGKIIDCLESLDAENEALKKELQDCTNECERIEEQTNALMKEMIGEMGEETVMNLLNAQSTESVAGNGDAQT